MFALESNELVEAICALADGSESSTRLARFAEVHQDILSGGFLAAAALDLWGQDRKQPKQLKKWWEKSACSPLPTREFELAFSRATHYLESKGNKDERILKSKEKWHLEVEIALAVTLQWVCRELKNRPEVWLKLSVAVSDFFEPLGFEVRTALLLSPVKRPPIHLLL